MIDLNKRPSACVLKYYVYVMVFKLFQTNFENIYFLVVYRSLLKWFGVYFLGNALFNLLQFIWLVFLELWTVYWCVFILISRMHFQPNIYACVLIFIYYRVTDYYSNILFIHYIHSILICTRFLFLKSDTRWFVLFSQGAKTWPICS